MESGTDGRPGMMFRQFDISTYVRCAATDDERYQCILKPRHGGPHEWGRCAFADEEGHRCFLPPGHSGRHDLPWFDRPTPAGARHTVRYGGSERYCRRRSDADTHVFRAHDWVPVSSEFTESLPRLWSPLRLLVSALASGHGSLDVVYEYRAPEPEAPP